jgi:signal transduction histidine kinase/ActR/RegA family two-component response regulator
MTSTILALRQTQGPTAAVVSDVYFAPLGKHHSFSIQVPVERNGRVLYYLGMGTFTSRLQKLLEAQKLPAGWVATILDRQGVIAARTHDPARFVGMAADRTLQRKISTEKHGTNDGVTLDGTPVTAFFSQASYSGWSFVVSVPHSALIKPATRATTMAAIIALLLLGIGAAAAVIIARKTATSMEALRLTAAELGQGKLVARQSTGVLEIDTVSMELANASEKIRSSKADLEQRVADASAAAERSQKALLQSQKLEALGRLTGGIAHDFNNVMQTLSTGHQMVMLTVSDPRIQRTVKACQRAVERAAGLTRQLMAFGRAQDAHLETIELVKQLNIMQPLLIGGLRSNIRLQLESAPDLWPVTIDPAQLELALLNVAINARDAMPAGGIVTIAVRNVSLIQATNELAAADYVQIAVTDTGEGMTPEVINKALDPFFTTKPIGQGSGIGLPQAYGFAKQMGGSLVIDSAPGHGTTVSFYLPRAQRAEPIRESAPQREPMQGMTSQGKLLFVEDDPLVAAVVAPALRAVGFDVHEAAHAEEALGLLANHGPFEVMFSDIVMPGQLNGIDLAERIKENYPNTRIVLATGYSERRAVIPGVQVLAKPYDVADAVDLLTKNEDAARRTPR